MTSRVELDINAPQPQAAQLFADPRNNPRWMDDLERIEPISGTLGEPGSIYKMVPKQGTLTFLATVVSRSLPTEVTLSLENPRVSVGVRDTFLRLSDHKARLISEEVFTFKGVFGKVTGLLAHRAIRNAHRRHMESFKRFVESRAA